MKAMPLMPIGRGLTRSLKMVLMGQQVQDFEAVPGWIVPII
jgi:hypothetical protein